MVLTKDPIIIGAKKLYREFPRAKKSILLDTFVPLLKRSRKRISTVLNAENLRTHNMPKKGRPRIYTDEVTDVIIDMWKRFGHPDARTLKAQIRIVLPHYERTIRPLAPAVREKVLAISSRTISRRFQEYVRSKQKGRSTTRSAKTPLKQKIPVRTGQWEIAEAGYLEGDLVSHCGGKASDGHGYTLNTTDIGTQWFAARLVRSKEDSVTLEAMRSIEHHSPFAIKGLDTDNGSEFINQKWFNEFAPRLDLTRSRPNKKNDNAHIEQKNWHIIRRHFGYGRLDTDWQFQRANELYRGVFSDYINFFLPVRKVIAKVRVGAKILKQFDEPQTPYERVLADPTISEQTKRYLRKRFKKMNPFLLYKEILNRLSDIYSSLKPVSW